jgi:hypothetical protein
MTAQEEKSELNPVYTGVPSLTIAPDARGGAMGDVGAATSPDMVSQYWNAAKIPFAWSKAGVQLSYTPWLRKLVSDIDLAYLSGYYKLGSEDNQAIGASIRYFSLGKVDLTSAESPTPYASINPYEMAIDVSYSLKLTENFAGAVAFRYIRSDLGAGIIDGTDVGSAYAADVAGYYNKYIIAGSSECLLGLGFNISNIGTKISYDGGTVSHFLPTNLRLGASYLMPLDDYNTLSLNLDMNKYLVPTPPDTREMEASEKQAAEDAHKAISPITGIFKSFSDAPGGMKEEFQEIMWSAGAEYAYNNQFFVRGGYFYEHPNKGNRQYFSLGAGFKMNVIQVDVAYLMATAASNPLDQTFRFSLTFDMDGLKNLMQ